MKLSDANEGPSLATPEAFDDLYRRHNADLFRYLMRRVFEPQTALDLVAETFAQAFISRHRCRAQSEPEQGAWLFGIARNQLARYYRHGQAERRAVKRLQLEVPQLNDDEILEAQRRADLNGLRAAGRAALADVSSEHREALQLRIVEERPYADIAAQLGISEPTARARVSRGLRALGHALDHDPDGATA